MGTLSGQIIPDSVSPVLFLSIGQVEGILETGH